MQMNSQPKFETVRYLTVKLNANFYPLNSLKLQVTVKTAPLKPFPNKLKFTAGVSLSHQRISFHLLYDRIIKTNQYIVAVLLWFNFYNT